MTFCLAFVTDHWAFVASDTRARWKEYDADDPRDLATGPVRIADALERIAAALEAVLHELNSP